VRAALVASTPCRQRAERQNALTHTSWGWPGLKEVLSAVPLKPSDSSETPKIVVQISSVATLTEKWLNAFFDTLSTTKSRPLSKPTLEHRKPTTNIIFPTADEIRRSLDGYQSGASIHMKLQSPAQKKQLALLHPTLCHWAGDSPANNVAGAATSFPLASPQQLTVPQQPTRHALRRRAAPHIKTYIRFRDQAATSIDWALVTSANLSTQAWGALPAKDGEVRICSWEVGVVVWPALFADEGKEEIRMMPVFGRDKPVAEKQTSEGTVVGFRMPYDLPLTNYKGDEVPWCATAEHKEIDWKGCVWGGYADRA